ncbi:uncharacterized protein LOC141830869 [Curcuma longa]|uniref:uncharacterized protein LOC141830869 n=1 Tax=Curcuma longa TaxID=136217 RepID=UPI003D9E1A23
MGTFGPEAEHPLAITSPKRRSNQGDQRRRPQDPEDDAGNERSGQAAWPRRRGHGSGVRWEGFEEGSDGGEILARTRSLTNGDLEELKGCLDLGFGFSYDEIPGLCAMLPALELCYSMSRLLGGGAGNAGGDADGSDEAIAALPVANWKISSPGDHPDEVKARLKIWAQAVACTVRLHS